MDRQIINHLKQTPIEAVSGDLGLMLDSYHRGECPTGHPSDSARCFKLNLKTNKWKCFHCGRTGDNIELWQIVTGLGFTQAVSEMAQRYLGIAAKPGGRFQRKYRIKLSPIQKQIRGSENILSSFRDGWDKRNSELIALGEQYKKQVRAGKLKIADYHSRLTLLDMEFEKLDRKYNGFRLFYENRIKKLRMEHVKQIRNGTDNEAKGKRSGTVRAAQAIGNNI